MIVFDTAQSPTSCFRLRLDRRQAAAALADVALDQWRFVNPYNIQVTIPGKSENTRHYWREIGKNKLSTNCS